ncbi:uncharacterized protein [Coffea arabica]|uniref:Chromo domain-containing protein n=1 Tax=Coffea arabica TaxID=13443 RepID=A0A6P6VAQ6_COFAR|nr:uncharacterized protein LOC113718335 [Coffea arabica]
MTPFEALYGFKAPQVTIGPYLQTNVAALEYYVQNRQGMERLLKDNLEQVQAIMKQYVDNKISERTFAVGDWIFLKLQPYRQISMALRKNMKLAAKYYGPYQVIERIGAVAYKLKLPEDSKIHPVCHVSLLKKKVGEEVVPSTALPYSDEEWQLKVQPMAVLDRRMVKRKNSTAVQWLVQWFNSSPSNATWEDAEFICAAFPDFEP